ncbi:hypothetical protein C6A85_13430, partial [Mycobacterium sp. ITM-2017-0098]
ASPKGSATVNGLPGSSNRTVLVPFTVDTSSRRTWAPTAVALGQWLQVDFDRPVTNATLTITPSATAVGAQVRRLEVSTVNG